MKKRIITIYKQTRNINKSVRILVMVFALSLLSVNAFADDPGLPGGSDADAPIDGGLSLLVAAGVGYGAKKMRDSKSKNKKLYNK